MQVPYSVATGAEQEVTIYNIVAEVQYQILGKDDYPKSSRVNQYVEVTVVCNRQHRCLLCSMSVCNG